jgi:hypothetical protein
MKPLAKSSAQRTADETTRLLRQSAHLSYETEAIGDRTYETLVQQEEQLDHADHHVRHKENEKSYASYIPLSVVGSDDRFSSGSEEFDSIHRIEAHEKENIFVLDCWDSVNPQSFDDFHHDQKRWEAL